MPSKNPAPNAPSHFAYLVANAQDFVSSHAKVDNLTKEEAQYLKLRGFQISKQSGKYLISYNSPTTNNIDDVADAMANLKVSTKAAKFVASTIAYVPPRDYDEDSSDEEPDDEFYELLAASEDDYPYRAGKQKYKRKLDLKEVKKEGNNNIESKVAGPLLQKLGSGAFEARDQEYLQEGLSASIALNRIKSISTRRNKSLEDEVASNTSDSIVIHRKFGFFWECQWYNSEGKKVDYSEVRKFYKMLKNYDPDMAEEFLHEYEKDIPVPYQDLREYAKNHQMTQNLVALHRANEANAPIYMTIIDSDTVDFNGVFSAYLRITSSKTPTVMSTGYEFPEDSFHMQLASQIDRGVRLATAQHLPLSVYYPEPNMCVLIPVGYNTIPESFIDRQGTKDGACESAALLRRVKDRDGARFVFFDDNPLITTVPPRAFKGKTGKKGSKLDISFSTEFQNGASPTQEDIRLFKQVSQSHYHESVWYDNLYINRGFKIIGNITFYEVKALIAKIRQSSDVEKGTAILTLLKHVDPVVVFKIVNAAEAVNEYLSRFEKQYVRSHNEERLLALIDEECGIDASDLSRDKLLMLSKSSVIELIEIGLVDLTAASQLDTKILSDLLNNDEVVDRVYEENIPFEDLVATYHISNGNIRELLTRLECEYGDKLDLALEIAPDVDPVMLEYLDEEDLQWIREQLCESEQVLFDMNICPEPEEQYDDDLYVYGDEGINW